MIKKTIKIIIIMIIILISICIFQTLEYKYAKNIEFKKDNELIAVIYLGGTAKAYDYTLINKYYTKEEQESFKTLELGGEEYYLIIPRYNMDILVNRLSMAEDGGTNKEYMDTLSKPFFVKCNMSDIFPNAEISFSYKNKEYAYTPYISLMDGSVVVEEFVYLIEE